MHILKLLKIFLAFLTYLAISYSKEDTQSLIEIPLKIKKRDPETLTLQRAQSYFEKLQRPRKFRSEGNQKTQNLINLEKEAFGLYDVTLVSTILVGSNRKEFSVLYDTGSPWIYLYSTRCDNCPTDNRYDHLNSTTYVQKNSDFSKFRYVIGASIGYRVEDTICLSESICANNVDFMNVLKTIDDEGFMADGIMGLSPTTFNDGYDLMVDQLHNQTLINNRVFSFQVNEAPQESYFTLGGYNTTKYGLGDLTWHSIINKYEWGLNLNDVYLGDTILEKQAVEVMIDTGTSYLFMPFDDFTRFTKKFDDDYKCSWDQGWFKCDCTTEQYNNYPDIKFQIDDVFYTMTKENYIEIWEDQCYFKIMTLVDAKNPGFWIMGLNFFHNYYSVFDIDNQRIGFSVSSSTVTPEKLKPIRLSQGKHVQNSEQVLNLFAALAILLTLSVLIIIVKIRNSMQRSKQGDIEKKEELNGLYLDANNNDHLLTIKN